MAEVENEATHVWCHKLRIAGFFAAMRHYRNGLLERGLRVDYHELSPRTATQAPTTFQSLLSLAIARSRPERVIVVLPGDLRVLEELRAATQAAEIPLDVLPDRHFYSSPEEFDAWAAGRRQWKLEDYYRMLRRKHGILMEGGRPAGGAWNFDQDNRKAFGKGGPKSIKPPTAFAPDGVTRDVIDLVNHRFADHPGSTAEFDLPVTPQQAEAALADFIQNRLPRFGDHQDAMWTGQAFLNHSRLSFALNLHLIEPRRCVGAAEEAYAAGHAPLNAVEGFIRQVLGWREYVRGVYWRMMPEYIQRNALECEDMEVPRSYWDGQTEMACVRDCMATVLRFGYAHHIQRLMVLGLFAQLLGVHPRRFHDWHMAMYVDAIDWVSLPNTLGMSQYGDGGVVGTKPYCASGAYIQRMSNYCSGCKYKPTEATGENACPITTLYWDFLDRHGERFSTNPRMVFQIKNLEKKSAELPLIREQAAKLRQRLAAGEAL